VLGVLPVGTGNDLARTLAIPLDVPIVEVLDLLARGSRRTIDGIRVTDEGGTRIALNACSGGFTGQVAEATDSYLKSALGALAYTVGTAKALPTIESYHAVLTYDGDETEHVSALNLLVANGRTIGGGTPVAPMESLEDGLLDMILVHEGGPLDIARLATKAYTTGYTGDAKVLHRRVREVHIASEPDMAFSVDGELHTNTPATFAVEPGALRAVVGPAYVAAPA
jgi:diacylglycerol kinase (ATP)